MGLVAVVVAAVPGLLGFEPLAADPAAPSQEEAEGAPPELSLPEMTPQIPAEVPSEPNGSIPAPVTKGVEDLPDRGAEIVERRDAVTEVFAATDGSEIVELHSEPVHFQPDGSASWEKIDNTLVADVERAGWVRNAANDWTVRFGPLGANGVGGVELVTDAGVVQMAPERTGSGASKVVKPIVGRGDKSDTVTYADVWPGVDVRYTVTGGRVKEDIVVEDGVRSEFPFVVTGLGLVEEPAPAAELPKAEVPDVTGVQAETVELAPLTVIDAKGRAAEGSEAAIDVEAAAAAPAAPAVERQRVVVSVDEGWMDDQADGAKNVVVDPTTVVVGGLGYCSYYNVDEMGMCDGLRTGNH